MKRKQWKDSGWEYQTDAGSWVEILPFTQQEVEQLEKTIMNNGKMVVYYVTAMRLIETVRSGFRVEKDELVQTNGKRVTEHSKRLKSLPPELMFNSYNANSTEGA